MMRIDAVTGMFRDLRTVELTGWIERGWVRPERQGGSWVFHEVDVARVRLIYDLSHEMATPEDTLPMILSLMDQVYEMRAAMGVVNEVLARQPAELQSAVLDALRERRGRKG